jgi:predicted permease
MSRAYERGSHDMNIDGNERMNIRCERNSRVVLLKIFSLAIRVICVSVPDPMRSSLCVMVGLCISCILASNLSHTTIFPVLDVNRFI